MLILISAQPLILAQVMMGLMKIQNSIKLINGILRIVKTMEVKQIGFHLKCLQMMYSTNSLMLTFRKGVMEIVINTSNPSGIGTRTHLLVPGAVIAPKYPCLLIMALPPLP